MRIQKTVRWTNVDELKDEVQSYQRPLENTRLKKINEKMSRNGFYSYRPIVVNQSMQIVDGQHRYKVAKNLGLTEVPVVIATFDSYDEEAMEFVKLNEDRTSLSPMNEFAARKEYGCPIAQLLYKLNEDRNSPLYKRIELRGTGRTDHPKFSITSVGQLLTTVLFNLRADHFKALKGDYERKVSELDYDEAIRKLHIFWGWFKEFSEVHFNDAKYPQMVLPPVFITFLNLREQGYFRTAKAKKAAKKLKSFPFSEMNFRKSDRQAQIQSVSSWLISKFPKTLEGFDPWRSYVTT